MRGREQGLVAAHPGHQSELGISKDDVPRHELVPRRRRGSEDS
jgi:hypothetical protein